MSRQSFSFGKDYCLNDDRLELSKTHPLFAEVFSILSEEKFVLERIPITFTKVNALHLNCGTETSDDDKLFIENMNTKSFFSDSRITESNIVFVSFHIYNRLVFAMRKHKVYWDRVVMRTETPDGVVLKVTVEDDLVANTMEERRKWEYQVSLDDRFLHRKEWVSFFSGHSNTHPIQALSNRLLHGMIGRRGCGRCAVKTPISKDGPSVLFNITSSSVENKYTIEATLNVINPGTYCHRTITISRGFDETIESTLERMTSALKNIEEFIDECLEKYRESPVTKESVTSLREEAPSKKEKKKEGWSECLSRCFKKKKF